MKKQLFLPLLSILFLAPFVACDKDDDDDEKTKTELVSQGSWKYESAMVDSDNNGTGDSPVPASFIAACQTDNVITISANGTGTIDEGATKCNVGDPQTSPFTWVWGNNETTVTFNTAIFAGASGEFKVLSVTETNLVMSKQVTVPSIPFPVTVIATFKH